jgi:hypothetical protein
MVHLRATKGPNGDDFVPVFWNDNYFSLFPGEERKLSVSFTTYDPKIRFPSLFIDGYNVAPAEVPLSH